MALRAHHQAPLRGALDHDDRGASTPTGLDWSRHRIGPLAPCLLCGQPALLRDDRGRPCHKICAEAVQDRAELADWHAMTLPDSSRYVA